jgi:hypothetical protein
MPVFSMPACRKEGSDLVGSNRALNVHVARRMALLVGHIANGRADTALHHGKSVSRREKRLEAQESDRYSRNGFLRGVG